MFIVVLGQFGVSGGLINIVVLVLCFVGGLVDGGLNLVSGFGSVVVLQLLLLGGSSIIQVLGGMLQMLGGLLGMFGVGLNNGFG